MGVQNPNSTGYVHPDEPNLLNIHKAMEYNSLGQPVIRVLCESGGGTMDLTALSVVTTSSYLGGSLSYDNTTGVFTFAPANELGNLVVNGTNLQTISGTVNGADIILEPLNGSVQVPALKIGSLGSVVNTTLNIEAYITTYEFVSIVDSSTGPSDPLASGVYGNINGVPAPWTVFELTPGISGTSIDAIDINDKLTGAGIIPSTVRDRGLGGPGGGDTSTWNSYVIVDLDLAGLGQVLPLPGATFNLTRPLDKANLNIQSATGTDIFLDSQGLGDVIVNTNILPVTTNISNLGSPTKRWKSVYVGPGTIYVLDETLGKDIAIGARDGLLYVQNGSGLKVGEFTLVDNQLKIANPARDMIIGSSGATASVVFNRAIKVKDSLGALAFEVDRSGITSIFTPSGADPNKGTLNIIGTASGLTQPRGTLYDGTLLHLTAQDGKSSRISSDSFGTGTYPLYAGRAARGTVAAPTASQSGDILSRFSAVGYGDSEYKTGISRFDAVAAENFTNSAAGTKFTFQTTPTGSVAAQLSTTINSTGITFAGAVDTTAGITFRNGDRLTYFPTPAGNTNYYLKSNGSTMSWQPAPTYSGTVIFKGPWDATANSPSLSANQVGAESGWEYIVTVAGTRDLGNGSVTFNVGDLVIYDGATWNDIPGNQNTVTSIKFNGGSARTGAVQVDSSDITSTLNTGSIANDKLANSSVTVNAGSGLSGGGTVALGNSITITNAGVTGISSGTGISVSGTGNITVTNTGVLTVTGTNHISASVVNGVATVTSNATVNDIINTIALRDSVGGLTAKDFSATLDASISSDHGPFNYGTLSYADTGIMADFSYSTNSYNQVVLQNRSAGDAASANYIVSNNQGTASTYYGEFGMNSSGYSGTGSFALPNAVYLASVSSDLVIGTLGSNSLRIVTNNSSTDAVSVNSSGVATFANQIVGSISGSANNVRQNLTAGTGITFSTGTTYNGATAITINNSITQYTDALARGAISVSGSLGYSSSTGVISYTTPTYSVTTASASGGGALSLTGNTFTFTPASIPSYGVGGNQLVYELNGSLALTSAKNTLVSMFGLTSGVALASNTRYQYEIVFTLSSNKAGDISYALALSGGAVVAQHNFQWMANKTATIDGYGAGIAMASFNATGAAITTAKNIAAFDNFTHVVIYGNIDITTAGNVNFMLSQDQNTPITWTMLPGAYVKLLPLGAIGANTVAGTWA